ncbi:MAG: nucleotidyl transferase AbiEii/AbiGii toxin family protein [Actinobacteria bacterium]|nr:nucleotidyl transferase AbiEii/AbiGii toxin family protein [Actinomycetota bacterium]
MLFTELIFATHKALDDAGLEHAFGGALALMHYVAEPRTTWDVDVNISVSRENADVVVAALSGIVQATEEQVALLKRDGQVRLLVGRYPLDIFLAEHEFHDEMRMMSSMRPFGDRELPYISATHLTVLKAMFNRSKDWVDIESMLRHGSVDVQRAIGWLVTLKGPDEEAPARIRAMSLLGPEVEPNVRELFNQKKN